jgi:hypothetical protein
MKFLALFFIAMTSLQTYSAVKNFEIQIKEISIAGHMIATNKSFALQSDQIKTVASFTDKNSAKIVVELTVSPNNMTKDNRILTKFKITKEEQGHMNVIAAPQIISKPGQEAQIAEGNDGEPPTIKVTIVAQHAN